LDLQLVERFFKKQCTAEEAEQVAEYLKANPGLLGKYLSEYEWNDALAGTNMPADFWNEVWSDIQKNKKAKIIQLWLKRCVAAACIILLIDAAYYLFIPREDIKTQTAGTYVLPPTEHQIIKNTTNKKMEFVLHDSSIVKLSPASTLQYDTPFQDNKREVWLDGEAYFKVAKDKARPFTVHTGILATTALGTAFSIKTNGKQNNILVKLFTGKVVITAPGKNAKGWDKDIYLLPGEQMNFNAGNMQLAVEKIENDASSKKIPVAAVKEPVLKDTTDELSFSNSSLPAVMNKLSDYYKVKIEYDKALLDTMNFTGTISRKDSLPVILQVIAGMNDLDVSQKQDEFIITKSQQ